MVLGMHDFNQLISTALLVPFEFDHRNSFKGNIVVRSRWILWRRNVRILSNELGCNNPELAGHFSLQASFVAF